MIVDDMTWNMMDAGRDAERYAAIVGLVNEHRPLVLFGQEFFVPPDTDANSVVGQFAAATNMDGYVAVEGNYSWPWEDGHARHALGILWRDPIKPVPGSMRVVAPEVMRTALIGVTLTIDGIEIDHWVYHGPARLGRDEDYVENERVGEALLLAAAVTGDGANPAVVCADWNTLPADRGDDGAYWHPEPVFPPGLTPAMERLAASRAPGEVLVQAGLASAAATLRRPLEATSTGHGPPPGVRTTDYGRRHIDDGLVTEPLARALVDHCVLDTGQIRQLSDHLPVMFTYETGLIERGG